MKPVIVKYSDYTRDSNLGINPRFEWKISKVKKRQYRKQKQDNFPLVLYERSNSYSIREPCILTTDSKKAQKKKKFSRPSSSFAKKPKIPSEYGRSAVNWDFSGLLENKRGQWLFDNNKPEYHFTPKIARKKIPLTKYAISLKSMIQKKKQEKKKNDKQKLEQRRDSPKEEDNEQIEGSNF